MMKLHDQVPDNSLKHIIDNADALCKEYDAASNCKDYLYEKLNAKNTSAKYFENNNGDICGLSILEIIDKQYGNLIVHTINEEDEAYFAHLLTTETIIDKNILELIQFRSNFNYRDEFLRLGLREKERVRMSHHSINSYKTIRERPNISFQPLTEKYNDICGNISYNAHKHRIHVECYDVYSSPEKRAGFAHDLRNQKHGKTIDEACLVMAYNQTSIGVIEMVHVKNWNMDIGWIMDVALLPEYQGMGLGKYLVQKSLSELYKKGYSSAGLGVTITNKNAHQLYESLGFEDYEFFVEIIGG